MSNQQAFDENENDEEKEQSFEPETISIIG